MGRPTRAEMPGEDLRVAPRVRLVRYIAIVVVGFSLLYLLTRSTILIGDAAGFIEIARGADPAQIHYGEPNHFLQVPTAHAVWRVLGAVGVPVSLTTIFVACSLAGTVAAIVFVGLIAAELLQTEAAAWLAALLFGTSLHAWTQWNGELYGLALGFVTAGIFFTLRQGLWWPAVLWSLAVLSHSDFMMAAPAFVTAVWLSRPDTGVGEVLRRASVLLVAAATTTCVAMLLGSWMLGKWGDPASFARWLAGSYAARQQDVAAHPEVARAIKGLVTAYTVAGHYWRDILSGRGQYSAPWFVPAAGTGLVVLLVTGVFVAAAAGRRRLFWFALAWLLPFHVFVNWWFVPTVEKYHAGALPGFVLLVTGGLIRLGATMSARTRLGLNVTYVTLCMGLNCFGAVLPMQARGRDTRDAEHQLRHLVDEHHGSVAFVACDNPTAVVNTGVEYLRVRSVWTGTLPEIEERIVSWTRDRLRDGKQPYLVGRWCLPEEWKTTASRAPFDLRVLDRALTIGPVVIAGIPISESVPTNPFSWTRGDVSRLAPD